MGILYKTNRKNYRANSRGTIYKKLGTGSGSVLSVVMKKYGTRKVEAIPRGKNYEIYLRTNKKIKRR
jgi:hypothetical protein